MNDDAIDDLVQQWHEGAGQGTLAEFLGMTPKEYAAWVSQDLRPTERTPRPAARGGARSIFLAGWSGRDADASVMKAEVGATGPGMAAEEVRAPGGHADQARCSVCGKEPARLHPAVVDDDLTVEERAFCLACVPEGHP